jgi:hypothetical protein
MNRQSSTPLFKTEVGAQQAPQVVDTQQPRSPTTLGDIVKSIKLKNKKIKKRLRADIKCLEEENVSLRVYMSTIEHRNHFLLQKLTRMLDMC